MKKIICVLFFNLVLLLTVNCQNVSKNVLLPSIGTTEVQAISSNVAFSTLQIKKEKNSTSFKVDFLDKQVKSGKVSLYSGKTLVNTFDVLSFDDLSVDLLNYTCSIDNTLKKVYFKDKQEENFPWLIVGAIALCCVKADVYSDGSWHIGWDCSCAFVLNNGTDKNGATVFDSAGKAHNNITEIVITPVGGKIPPLSTITLK